VSQPAAAPFPLLPRSPARRALAVAAAYLALTMLFVVARFPVDSLTPRVAALASAATGAQVEIGRLDAGLRSLLPALQASDVSVTTPGGTRLRLDRARVRPAWSLSWLRGRPALAISLRAGESRVDGTVRLGPAPGFTGDLEKVDLRLLPASLLGDAGVTFDGRLDGTLDLQLGELGPEGDVKLHAADGSLTLPGLPIGIPYQSIDAEATLGGDLLANLTSLAMDGPMLALHASGTVGRGPTPSLAPLALEGRLEVREPALRDLAASSGIALGPDGTADLAVSGTLDAPQLGRATPGARGGAPRRQ